MNNLVCFTLCNSLKLFSKSLQAISESSIECLESHFTFFYLLCLESWAYIPNILLMYFVSGFQNVHCFLQLYLNTMAKYQIIVQPYLLYLSLFQNFQFSLAFAEQDAQITSVLYMFFTSVLCIFLNICTIILHHFYHRVKGRNGDRTDKEQSCFLQAIPS